MSVKISLGNKKRTFKSIKLAAKESGIPYMTLYMRIRMGKTVAQAMKEPVRKYTKVEG
jgi:hypothetical protein